MKNLTHRLVLIGISVACLAICGCASKRINQYKIAMAMDPGREDTVKTQPTRLASGIMMSDTSRRKLKAKKNGAMPNMYIGSELTESPPPPPPPPRNKTAVRSSPTAAMLINLDKGQSQSQTLPVKATGRTPAGVPVIKRHEHLSKDVKAIAQKLPAPAVKQPDTVLKSAALGVSYFPRMKIGETKIITVHVAVNQTEQQIKTDMRKLERQETKWLKKTDTTAILTSSLQLYDSLKISLNYDSSDFEVQRLHANDDQLINFKTGNKWIWQIKAISLTKHQTRIILNVDAHTPDGAKQDLTPYDIPIVINFDLPGMLRGWARFLGQHPAYTVPSVLVPIVVAVYKRKRKKSKATIA